MRSLGSVLMSFVVLVAMWSCKKAAENETADELVTIDHTEIPPIMLKRADGSEFPANELTGATILVFFQPDCDHCQREAADIAASREYFEPYQMYFISPEEFSIMEKFQQKVGMDGMENVHFVQTSLDQIWSTVGPVSTPCLFIFSEKGKFVKKIDGEKPVGEIIPFL